MDLYFSKLTLNPMSRKVIKDMNNTYELHRTVLSAFPDNNKEAKSSVLFRLDETRDKSRILLVQSHYEPDWQNIEEGYLSEDVDPKKIDIDISEGGFYIFRLRGNVVKRIPKKDDDSGGYLQGLYKMEDQHKWIERKAENGGFDIVKVRINPEGHIIGKKNGKKLTFNSVVFDGVLRVDEATKFNDTFANGIGRAKRFGFGLLSLKPLR